jgi:DNA-binding CsgD family transcriptional regulator
MISWTQIEGLVSARTIQDLINAIFAYKREAGFNNFALAIKFSTRSEKHDAFFIRHDYAFELLENHTKFQCPEFVNKIARFGLCLRKKTHIAWNSDGWIHSTSSLDPKNLTQCGFADGNMRSGIMLTLSLHDIEWGFIAFTSNHDVSKKELDSRILDSIHFIDYCSHIFEKISKKNRLISELSSRETEALEWAVVGKTSWEIARILHISERTVNFHLSNAASKLGVKGRRAACTAAMARGLINT